jgi:hypothetical protein
MARGSLVKLRYGWKIADIPSHCICGEKNDIDHTLICKHGGHVIFRHNRIRDVNTNFLRQVCHNVVVEPELLPLESTSVVKQIHKFSLKSDVYMIVDKMKVTH